MERTQLAPGVKASPDLVLSVITVFALLVGFTGMVDETQFHLASIFDSLRNFDPRSS